MASSFHDFTQVPADSPNGKRIHAVELIMLGYNTAGGNVFSVGETVTGSSSGTTGTVVGTREQDTNTGHVIIQRDINALEADPTAFTTNENLLVDASPVAQADDAGRLFFGTTSHIVGVNNPLNGMFVDEFGAVFVRYDDGPQQLDAFGNAKASSTSVVGDYTLEYGDDGEFQTTLSGGGTSIHLPNENGARLQVGTASGASVFRRTNKYHLSQAGMGQLAMTSITIGDTGKANVERRWGYFDDNDGAFFRLNGTALELVCRSSTSGSVVDTVVSQASWNGDRVDGNRGQNNLSGELLNVSNSNLYWFELRHLGSARVRVGVFLGGRRIVLHTFSFVNISVLPAIRSSNLPLSWDIENTATSGSTSEMKVFGSSVHTEGRLIADFQKRTAKFSFITDAVLITAATEVVESHLMTFRSKTTFNSVVNRKISIPEMMNIYSSTSPLLIKCYKDVTLSGASYADIDTESATEVTTAGTITTPGRHMFSMVIGGAEVKDIDAPKNFGYLGEHLRINADGTVGNTYTFTAQLLDATDADSDVRLGMTHIEMG